MRAVIYARCSTEEESQKDALRNQVEEARRCIRKHCWKLSDEYIESRSGTTVKGRTEYQRLFADLQTDRFDVIVIKSQDRLMRNTKDWYLFLDRLCTNKKKLYMYIENKFYTPDDALLTGIKAILAEEYSRELSKKINLAHRSRQKNGGPLILTEHAYGFRKNPDKTISLIEEEAKIKEKMYQMSADGYGGRRIAAALTEEGYRKRNGEKFTANDILRILRNPLNMGTAVMNRRHYDFESKKTETVPKEKQFRVENKVPATVSRQLWEQANASIDRRRTDTSNRCRGRNKEEYPLSGKLICGLCGMPYYRRVRKRKDGCGQTVEWKCRNYILEGRKSGCRNISVEEQSFFTLLEQVCGKDRNWDAVKAGQRLNEILCDILKEKEEKRSGQIREEEKKLIVQMDRLTDKLLDGILSDEIYVRRKAVLEEELLLCREKREKLQSDQDHTKEEQREKEIQIMLEDPSFFQRAVVQQLLQETETILLFPDHMIMEFQKPDSVKEGTEKENQLEIPFGPRFDYKKRKEEERKALLRLLQKQPHSTAKEIAEITGWGLSAVKYKLRILEKEGKLRFCGKGGKGFWQTVVEEEKP